METIDTIFKQYGYDKQSQVIRNAITLLSTLLSDILTEEQQYKIVKDLYALFVGGHYNESFADDQVGKMYYEKDGSKYNGPFLNKDTVLNKYREIRNTIPDYNEWDFYVTVQMIYSDNYNIIYEWFPNISEQDFNQKIYQLATNWLNDKDNPFGNSKIWCYFNNNK